MEPSGPRNDLYCAADADRRADLCGTLSAPATDAMRCDCETTQKPTSDPRRKARAALDHPRPPVFEKAKTRPRRTCSVDLCGCLLCSSCSTHAHTRTYTHTQAISRPSIWRVSSRSSLVPAATAAAAV